MSFSCVHSGSYVHALLFMVRQAVLPFSLGQSKLIYIKTANRLTYSLLLVVKVISVNLKELAASHWVLLPDQRWIFAFICFNQLELQLTHSSVGCVYRMFLHCTGFKLIFRKFCSIFFVFFLSLVTRLGRIFVIYTLICVAFRDHAFSSKRLLFQLVKFVDDDASIR